MDEIEKNIDRLFDGIVLADAMKLKVTYYSGEELELSAPLASNINDKGTGFAGSIYSAMVLSGWGLVTQWLRENNINADVMIMSSETGYSAPTESTLEARAKVRVEDGLDLLLQSISEKGRGKIEVSSTLTSNNKICASFKGIYFARLR